MTSLIFLAIKCFFDVWMRWFYAWSRMKVYMINFYHHYSISGPTLVAGGILLRQQVLVSFFLLFVYILKFVSFLLENEYGRFRLLRHTVWAEIHTRIFYLRSYQKNFGFHRNQCKRQIMYGKAHDSWCTVFKTDFNCSSGMLPSFILRYAYLPKLTSVLCRIPKANLYLRKLKIFSYGILYPP